MEGVHLGTMGGSYDFWIGNFYPEEASPDSFLAEYAKHYHTVEVNSTFYRIPSKRTVKNWYSQTPEKFIFSMKFPRAITHQKRLDAGAEKMEIFLKNISNLGDKLGPLLLQFPPQFKAQSHLALKDFLKSLPRGHLYAVEFRDKRWLTDEIFETLMDNGVALVLVDNSCMPTLEEVTSSFVYLRWQGDRRQVKGDTGSIELDRGEDLKRWAESIKGFLERPVEVYGYFSKFFSGHPPTDVKQLLEYCKIIVK